MRASGQGFTPVTENNSFDLSKLIARVFDLVNPLCARGRLRPQFGAAGTDEFWKRDSLSQRKEMFSPMA
jgi:hypothetical protein